MTEIWKDFNQDLVQYECVKDDTYQVSNLGNVRNKKTCKVLKRSASCGNSKIPKVQVVDRFGLGNSFNVAHLVYDMFGDQDSYCKKIKYKDGDSLNCNIENLYI